MTNPMKLHQQLTPNMNTIRAFEPGRIRINNEEYYNSLIVTAEKVEKNWQIKHPEQITENHIAEFLKYKPEIILIGTGHRHHFLDPVISLAANQHGLGIEIMTTEAACHTYNILLGEDRAVLAALIIEN
jgi:uncharacterized protein